ncbi:MAG: 3-methyl-2-oxobutanoate hydroxymethyltransferase [Planctomycetota bacterium]|jgi:3-methyl-2-oxobutanoate hydroxymethyltransferase
MATVRTGHRPEIETTAGPPAAARDAAPGRKPITISTLVKFVERGEPFACLTCYDATTARWFEAAGVPVLLVGDTAAEMILGLPGTIHAPLDFLILLTASVKRGAPNTHVMGDMPFMSYQADDTEAMRNAGRFMTEGRADSVKLEVDRSFAPLVEKMSRAGIPVVAHIGARPQRVKLRGSYRSVGRTAEEARTLARDARALEDAGASMLLVEAVPHEVSQQIVSEAGVPVIGCGAGPACHGQIVVMQDLLGLSSWQPSFARPIVDMGEQLAAAARQWIRKVSASDLGEHPYRMSEGEMEKWTRGQSEDDRS